MDSQQKQAKRILDELVDYFWNNKIYHLDINFESNKDYYIIDINGFCPVKPENFDEFKRSLQIGHQPEIEEYYDQLLGINSNINESYLLGAVIDNADISYEQQMLRVSILKYNSTI